jgi:hypothetical protein
MKYIKLFESFSAINIEENLDSLLSDIADMGFGYDITIKDETYINIEIYKGSIPVNQREPFDHDDRDEVQFDLSDIQEEVEYIVEYMMQKLGDEYEFEFEYEDSWEQHTFYDLQEENAQDIIALNITFQKKS